MVGGCIVGDFQIEIKQSSQYRSCVTGANFYRYLMKKDLKENKEVNLLMFV